MANDIEKTDFFTLMSNTSVAACFTSSATLPSAISSVEVLASILDGYRMAQNESNENNTGADFINTIVGVSTEPVLLDEEGNPYRDVVITSRIRKNFAPASNVPYTGGVQII